MSIPISIVLCLVFTALTGSVAYGFFWLICKANRTTNVLKSRYILLKVVILTFVIPICFLLEILLTYESGTFVNTVFKVTPFTYKVSWIVLAVWIVGALLRCIDVFTKTKKHRMRVKTYLHTQNYQDVLQSTKDTLGIKRKIQIKEGEYYESPLLTGVFAPAICLPMKDFDKGDLPYIFMHELLHYKQKDMMFLRLLYILTTVYWFHPLFWNGKLILQYRTLMEDACDISVCKQVANYREYVAVLLRMIMTQADIQKTAPVFLAEAHEDVVRRIDNMERYKRQKPLKRILITTLIVVVFCASTLVVYAAERGVVAGYHKVYDATWEGLEEEMNGNTANTLTEVYELAVEDPAITVEYVEEDTSTYASAYTFDYTIAGNTEKRKSSGHELSNGDKVLVSLTVDPSDKNVKVGFYMSGGYVRYITGSGDIYHTFTIYDDDTYTFFVQNNNSSTVEVDGYYSIR